MTVNRRTRAIALVAVAGLVLATPTAWSALDGSGNLTDVVDLNVVVGSLLGDELLSGASDLVSSSSPFEVNNGLSNVDTFIRFGWSSSPHYGGNSAQTSISLRGVTHHISDLLWFKQEVRTGEGVTTTSEYFGPVILKNAADTATSTWTAAGNACTAWTGTPYSGFSATAAGTFTFKYHAASAPVDDTPSTSGTFHYCVDTTNQWLYIGTSADYTTATRIVHYTEASSNGQLKPYQYQFLSGAQLAGNKYCLTGITGTGTAATPILAQCLHLPYSSSGSATGKIYPLFDPPDAFPSSNQLGRSKAFRYDLAGTQWNPYDPATTNSA